MIILDQDVYQGQMTKSLDHFNSKSPKSKKTDLDELMMHTNNRMKSVAENKQYVKNKFQPGMTQDMYEE